VLAELTIRDFAIIDELHIRFRPGLNVLTGETGAGKSIIVDAVSLLLGGRGETDFIRAGCERAILEGVFLLDQGMQETINPLLEQDGLEGDGVGVLLLARELRREGRNVCRVNGRAVTVKVLSSIGQHLVDIHGQTEHLSLMRVREHIDLLDRYGDLWDLRQEVAGLVEAVRSVRRELAELRRDERSLARRVDLLEHQVREIETARLEIGEEEELLQERNRLANAEELAELAGEVYQALYETVGDQPAAVDLIQLAVAHLSRLSRLDESTRPLGELAESLSYQLEDLAQTVRDYRDEIEFNPRRLSQVQDRLGIIRNLQRKYGDSVEDILSFGERARQELQSIEHSEERLSELEAEEERLLHEIGRIGSDLSSRRRESSERLGRGIEAQLTELNMARAQFGTDIRWREDADGAYVDGRRVAFDRTGLDRVEFLVAPNVGEPFKPLVRVASGGETSRLMLALKTVLARADRTPTLIFDEIDAGVGGPVGSVVGQKLWSLTLGDGREGWEHQVLCVTHLPQLASYGDWHLHVRKSIVGDRTVTSVESLESQVRVRELAGMLGAVTEKTRASAKEMLAASRVDKEHRLEAIASPSAVAA
jgi:DNA repair protein RecN (Recombination protein N)